MSQRHLLCREEGSSPKPLPLSLALGRRVARTLVSTQGLTGSKPGRWLGSGVGAALPVSHTCGPCIPIWSTGAESLGLPYKTTKASRFHSRKPPRPSCSACLLCCPSWSGQELGKWQLSCPGERGLGVAGLGPHWGPYAGGGGGQPE